LLSFGLFVLIGFALVRFSGGKQIRKVVGAGVIIASLFFLMLLLGIRLVPDFLEYRHDYAIGNYKVVEGRVENFRPMPQLGPANESFSVAGVDFSYNVLDSAPCFGNTPAHEGPIHSGVEVRIYYTDECILRVDVRR
jgi:hypothetical protein